MPSLVGFAKSLARRIPIRKRKLPKDYVLNEPLEEAAAPNRVPLHPVAKGIMKKSGLLSMIRNRGNQQVIDPEDPAAGL